MHPIGFSETINHRVSSFSGQSNYFNFPLYVPLAHQSSLVSPRHFSDAHQTESGLCEVPNEANFVDHGFPGVRLYALNSADLQFVSGDDLGDYSSLVYPL